MGFDVEIDIHEGHMRLSCSNWKLCLDRMLSSAQISELHTLETVVMWDDDGKETSMPKAAWFVKQIAPDIDVLHWEHKPIYVKITSVACGTKIYEMLNCSSFQEAAKEARRTWHEQFSRGPKSAILSAKLASKRDMRRSVEINKDDN